MKSSVSEGDFYRRPNYDTSDDLISEKHLRPEALTTLKTNRSIDKMVKSYVRKPVSNKNLQPKHLSYKAPVPISTVSSSSSLADFTQERNETHHNHGPFVALGMRRGSSSSGSSFMSGAMNTTEYVGIGVGGGEGVELPTTFSSSRISRANTPGGQESRGSGGSDYQMIGNPLPDRPASPLQYIAQPNHNNGSPRSPKRSDHFLPIWNEISSPTDFPPAPGRVDVRGAQIPASMMKDGMIDLVRKHDTAQRKRFVEQKKRVEDLEKHKTSDSPSAGITIVDSETKDIIKFMKKGEMGFEDSFDSNVDDLTYGLDSSIAMTASSQREIKSSKSYMDLTQKSKLSSMIRIEDDYAAKWMKMKAKRDERREREIRRAARAQIMQTFSQVVYNTEK